MFNKLKFLMLFGTATILLSGCESINNDEPSDLEETSLDSVNVLENVSMSAIEDSVSPTGLTVEFENDSEQQIIYSEDILLEENIADSWYQVPVVIEEDYGFHDIGYELNPGEQQTMEIDWEWLYGELDEGRYRIVKNVLDFRGTGDFDEHLLAAEFELD